MSHEDFCTQLQQRNMALEFGLKQERADLAALREELLAATCRCRGLLAVNDELVSKLAALREATRWRDVKTEMTNPDIMTDAELEAYRKTLTPEHEVAFWSKRYTDLLLAFHEATRWHYPPEMPTETGRYVVTALLPVPPNQPVPVVYDDIWTGDEWLSSQVHTAWAYLPEPYVKEETTR